MTERRRPAAASRVLATGLSIASVLAMTAGMARGELAAGAEDGAATTVADAPTRTVVIVRRHLPAAPAAAGAPAATAPAVVPPPAVPAPVPAPAAPAPVTRSRGS